MTANNIMMRRNSKHVVGGRLGRPWYLRIRPTFTRDNGSGVETAYNPWFAAPDVFSSKKTTPEPRNAYVWDLVNRFKGQRLACQRTITVGLKGLQNYAQYQGTEASTHPMVNNPWSTRDMMSSLPSFDPPHDILQSFDSSEGFDVPDFNACPLEEMQI